MPVISEGRTIRLIGYNSKEPIELDEDTLVTLIKAYMIIIPNESRNLLDAVKVVRLFDELNKLIEAEANALADEARRRTNNLLGKTEMVNDSEASLLTD
jgi:hypothetical protein